MKRITEYLNSFNLKEQLIALITLISVVLIVVSYFITFSRVNTFVNQEMVNLIDRSQKSIIHRYLVTDVDGANAREIIFDYNDPNITHFIYDEQLDVPLTNASTLLEPRVLDEIEHNIENQTQKTKAYSLRSNTSKDTYLITHIDDEVSIVTILSQSYQNDFRNIITQLVLFVALLSIGIILVFFLLWAGSIIRPLKDISVYLSEMNKTHRKKLDTTRKDEIGDVARSIVKMEEELIRQEKVKMEMVHNISHDLKTPITTIKTYSESIKDGIYPYETLEKSVDVILENADRLERKAHSLLLLNQLDALDDEPIEFIFVNMKDLISKVILSLRVIRPEIKIVTNLEDVQFNGDEELWRITLENLMDNAFRYARGIIEITLTKDRITIYNDGEKMAQDRIEKLFKPYEKGTDGQFGLGLSIVDRMTKRMGYMTRGYNHKDGVEFEIVNPNPQLEKTKRLRRHRKPTKQRH